MNINTNNNSPIDNHNSPQSINPIINNPVINNFFYSTILPRFDSNQNTLPIIPLSADSQIGSLTSANSIASFSNPSTQLAANRTSDFATPQISGAHSSLPSFWSAYTSLPRTQTSSAEPSANSSRAPQSQSLDSMPIGNIHLPSHLIPSPTVKASNIFIDLTQRTEVEEKKGSSSTSSSSSTTSHKRKRSSHSTRTTVNPEGNNNNNNNNNNNTSENRTPSSTLIRNNPTRRPSKRIKPRSLEDMKIHNLIFKKSHADKQAGEKYVESCRCLALRNPPSASRVSSTSSTQNIRPLSQFAPTTHSARGLESEEQRTQALPVTEAVEHNVSHQDEFVTISQSSAEPLQQVEALQHTRGEYLESKDKKERRIAEDEQMLRDFFTQNAPAKPGDNSSNPPQ